MSPLRNIIEPGAIVATFTAGTIINRRSNVRIRETPSVEDPLLGDSQQTPKPANQDLYFRSPGPRRTLQSRILAHFPFLLEIWYWVLTYWIYQGLRAFSARQIAGHKPIFDTAECHAHQILVLERFLHVDIELSVQRFVLEKIPWLMPVLAKIYYSHIVLGIMFLVYCYTFIPRDKYQGIRRALALENVIAFCILTVWRCMPPRLLPEEDGFIDVLHRDRSGSAWTQNKFQLTIAAMPSMHFGNSFFIAFCLLNFSPHSYLRAVAPLWPVMMGYTIFATANHFLLDACVGACVAMTAYRFNRVMLGLLPVERSLFQLLRVERPE
ncbi:hypothetical protein EYZ11_000152 [Aspergillus tanneri]|uniref:Inositolphosphotransferase Aur1/Ipt1 domain-containing protein n=1 Tax=Aspergillus tanneri TaxID=1220188 RepID=A0A4S3JXZ3_9EURO|nr:uncharacterized protein ATNIH1004_005658 [Aspergillus tanneri]KAA8646979.1 hypothetical protein ATNIH1004_005658 [Aspergillus tanneri]THD00425.1 hypothetical protein EYZ11_000152 [Aspergillus tanneri]